ncbi:MAG: phosphotransferase [Ardenticatenaceae bacterium]|nr:phosphotransferase [Ardenticatenaceae bacterium]
MTNMTNTLFLPGDVQLIPVEQLPQETRGRFQYEPKDVALTRQQSRLPTKIISEESAALLEQFRTGKTVVEAILRYCVPRSLNPQKLLQEVYPFIQQMVQTKLLVSNDTAADKLPVLHRGDQVDEFTVIRPLHQLQDTELYQAKTNDGTFVVLKLVRPDVSPAVHSALTNEKRILQQLNGKIAPALLGSGIHQERPYLAMAWCPGVNAAAAAESARANSDTAVRRRLLQLGGAILQVYADLHAQQLLHGDVHPGNLLIDAAGVAHLIDFGLTVAPQQTSVFRGGVPFYYEPEFATAALDREESPPLTAIGEQYAVAVLLYQMLTGHHYLDFSLEKEAMMAQIAEDPPLPFAHHGCPPWPEVEQLLAQALSKHPEARFESMAAFADAWNSIEMKETTVSPLLKLPATINFSQRWLERVGWKGDLFKEGLPCPPYASINFGAAGIAEALLRIASAKAEPHLLALANLWLLRAETAVGKADAFYNSQLEITPETVGTISILHTELGVHLARMRLAQAMGDLRGEYDGLRRYVQAANQPSTIYDVSTGIAGVLLHCAFLVESTTVREWMEDTGLLVLGETTFDNLWRYLETLNPIGPLCELTNLGAAHGWAGMLYSILRWCTATQRTVPQNFETRLHELAEWAEPNGRGVQWPWDLQHEQAAMPGWCNGSAGHIYLWTAAYQIFQQQRYLELAVHTGWHCWESPARVASLCCGLVGRSYALLHLSQQTREATWKKRAYHLADLAVQEIGRKEEATLREFKEGLFRGESGLAALLAELEYEEPAGFPFFA